MNKLKKRVKKLYDTSNSYEDGYYECICDEGGEIFGEYSAYENGVLNITGFCYDSEWIGILCQQGNFWYYSFLEIGKQITKEEFDLDYKKYLAKYRLGLEVPDGFLCLFILLKDYEEPRDFS